MKKRAFIFISLILMLFCFSSCNFSSNNNEKPDDSNEIANTDKEKTLTIKNTDVMGIGGCCALFYPKISTLDEKLLMVTSDMGGLYVSHDKGKSFIKNNLNGRVYASCFDYADENVIYAGGSGIYKSTNKGASFDLIFPKKEDIYKVMTKDESNRYYYYTKDSSYPTHMQVKEIIVNPFNNKEVYAIFDYYSEMTLYKSNDGGNTFTDILVYENKYNYNNKLNDGRYNEMFFDYTTKELIIVKCDGIYKLVDNELLQIYKSPTYLIDIDIAYDNNIPYYIIIEQESNNENCLTKLFYTADFENIVYLDDLLIEQKINQQKNWNDRIVEFKLKLENVTASSINNIYVTNGSNGYYIDTQEKYPYSIDSIIKIHNNKASWLYGLPSVTKSILTNMAWIDGCYDMFGICINPFNEESFLFTTLCGVYYAEANDKISQCYSNVYKDENGVSYDSTGIDCQTTYGLRVDPFNKEHIIMLNTDLGLSYSYNNGKSWNWAFDGVEKYRNTLYDAYFDKDKRNVLYGLWSSRHDAPYSAEGDEVTGVYGCFAISYDGGMSWDSNYSTGIPENAIPVKMSVIKKNDRLTFYVATFNEGFYVSYDSGKTFEALNEGLVPISYNNHNYIYGCDIESDGTNVYAIVSKTNYNNQTQPGAVYKLVDNKWEEIKIDDNLLCPRDLCINEGKLYISCVARNKYDWYTEITKCNNICGGIYLYENEVTTQIFDESISVAGVCFTDKNEMFVSDISGNIYQKIDNEYKVIYKEYHTISKGITYEDGNLYLPTLGGGLLKLEISYE